MAKNLKINIKNTQIAKALSGIQSKIAKKKPKEEGKPAVEAKEEEDLDLEMEVEETPKVRARSRSVFDTKKSPPSKKEAKPPVPEKEPSVEVIEEPAKPVESAPEDKAEPKPTPKIPPAPPSPAKERLGPTGKHISDLIPKEKKSEKSRSEEEIVEELKAQKKAKKGGKFTEFRDVKPKRSQGKGGFDSRDRRGLRSDEDSRYRKRRSGKSGYAQAEENVIRPTELSIRVPITIKDLAQMMKLKASQLIEKLFMQGLALTLNDLLDDETTLQLLGQEFGCGITLDTSEEERIRVTGETIREEIQATPEEQLKLRPPVVAFMGHVDHGKTSLIDRIRSSNRVAQEAGAITQHIGAFLCETKVGNISILDTPGHEAFSAMRARGADVTDIVVLVVAGDEGMKQQTIEAIQHAKAAGVTIVVAINKCDKPNFNPEEVYRQLSDHELLPESWGGQIITVNCSAKTGEGVEQLLEMLALQAEVLELRANPSMRARGRVLESRMSKGFGAVATVLVQNGTLKQGDALVFSEHWARVKTMHDEFGQILTEASPSMSVQITGMSGLPAAGQEFIIVKNEKEAREIAATRSQGIREQELLLKKKQVMESLLQQGEDQEKKVLNIVLRADVQGSLEALKTALLKIESDKIRSNIIFSGVGAISESDVQLAAASNALIVGFHTTVETHADPLIKELGVEVRLFDIIYHAIDGIKLIMHGMLDRVEKEEDRGVANVIATFKSSQIGVIAGCSIVSGTISRNHWVRIKRDGEQIWRGQVASIKREKEDVKEVREGYECGIVLNGFNALQVGDVIESFEIVYLTQEL